jgi:hypothetical protein|tara:strand:+ start:574 stop:795 length:222 start_codon:yes stop_codon:yes gene_type:complete
METAEARIQEYFTNLMSIVDQSTKSETDQLLMAGAMMAVAKTLYYENLTEKDVNHLMDVNLRDLINLIKPTIH